MAAFSCQAYEKKVHWTFFEFNNKTNEEKEYGCRSRKTVL
jgi:hypothetical protein